MKISIITVVYNNVRTIASAIESVIMQSYGDKEYIIIDGGSTDGTLDIIASYGLNVDKVVSEPDHGIFDAMNKGLALATGEVVAFLNSDDFYADEQVLRRVGSSFENSDTDAVFGDLYYVHSENTDKLFRCWKSGKYKPGRFLYGWMPPHPTFFAKRKVYEQYGNFNTGFRIAADYELMLRLVHVNNIKLEYIPHVLVKMRLGGVSNAGLKNRLRANREDREAWEVNGLQPYFFTLYLKPARKIFQFIKAFSLNIAKNRV